MTFKLANDQPAKRRNLFENRDGKQLQFISDGDDRFLPGQLDLFEHDGMPQKKLGLRLRDLTSNDVFRFADRDTIFEYHGNGWYGRPYSGGPWNCDDNPSVIQLEGEERESAIRSFAAIRDEM